MSALLYSPVIVLATLLVTGGLCLIWSGRRSPAVGAVSIAGLTLAIGAAAAAVALAFAGPRTIAVLGLGLRIDLISVVLMGLIALVGAIVLRFSRRYLDGDARQGAFLGWMSLTLAAVTALVLAGDLIVLVAAWIGVSLALHRLLLFYPERRGAQRAARKKFLISRLSDLALIGAALALWSAFGETDIARIAERAAAGEGASGVTLAAALLALAAVLKSAQFPTHGWLTEVMEAPTPVSALLHAGVVNAGGFLLIRFADVLVLAPGVLAALVLIGGFTALFGGLVMLTQSAVKTSLAWSTVAQMGFMIFQCGLALFPLALLHIVAHSLYKAHAFLSAGGAVDRVSALRRPGPVAIPGLGAVARAFGVALAVYGLAAAVFGFGLGFGAKAPQEIALGAILIFGVAYLIAQGFADNAPRALTRHTALYSVLAATAYFGLQAGAEALFGGVLPATPAPGPLEWALLVVALASFGLVAVAQAAFPLWSGHPAAAGLRVHLANGLYVNALTDRALGLWSTPAAPKRPLAAPRRPLAAAPRPSSSDARV